VNARRRTIALAMCGFIMGSCFGNRANILGGTPAQAGGIALLIAGCFSLALVFVTRSQP
jgi:hypothetical protein